MKVGMTGYLNYVKIATEKRLHKLRHIMKDEGLDSIILFEGDPIAHKTALTNHFNVVLVTHDDIHVVADPTLHHEAVRESPWNVVLVENFTLEELAGRVMNVLRERGKAGKPIIGVNKAWGRTRLTFLYADLIERLRSQGVEVVDATEVLVEVFDEPFEEELPIIKWISNAASKALQAVEEALRPGMHEYEVAAIADKVLDENGIVDRWFTTIVASGPRAAAPHAKTSARRISPGDPVVVDLGPMWMGYDGCVAHTFIAGRNTYWERILEDVVEAIRAGLEQAKPGTPAKVLDEAPLKLLRERGYPDYPHLTGHPVGGFYRPIIADFIEYRLEPGMVFAYEPAVYLRGKGGVRIEPHILVTSQGHQVLTEYHRKLFN